MSALQASVATVFENNYTLKINKYLKRKNFDVTTIGKEQANGELKVKSQINYNQQVL